MKPFAFRFTASLDSIWTLCFHHIAIDDYRSQSQESRRDMGLATLSQVGIRLDGQRRLLLQGRRFQGTMPTVSNVLMGMVLRFVHYWPNGRHTAWSELGARSEVDGMLFDGCNGVWITTGYGDCFERISEGTCSMGNDDRLLSWTCSTQYL